MLLSTTCLSALRASERDSFPMRSSLIQGQCPSQVRGLLLKSTFSHLTDQRGSARFRAPRDFRTFPLPPGPSLDELVALGWASFEVRLAPALPPDPRWPPFPLGLGCVSRLSSPFSQAGGVCCLRQRHHPPSCSAKPGTQGACVILSCWAGWRTQASNFPFGLVCLQNPGGELDPSSHRFTQQVFTDSIYGPLPSG